MAAIDENMKTSDGTKKRIRVPSQQGGTDRTIYVNGSNSGYRLGDGNNEVYTSGGRHVSKSLKDFVELNLWFLIREYLLSFFIA